jgi:hypothetical protein
MMTTLDTPPGWAFSWCWYFFLVSCLTAATALMTLITLVTMYKSLAKEGGVLLLSVYTVMLLIQAATSMVTFWMCRSSLKPKA